MNGKSRLGKKVKLFLSVGAGLVMVIVLAASLIGGSDAAQGPRAVLVDKIVLIMVDEDGDGKHDYEISVAGIQRVASFDDGTFGIQLTGEVDTLRPLSE